MTEFLCQTCKGLASAFDNYFERDEFTFSKVSLGSLTDLGSRKDCLMCQFFVCGLHESIKDLGYSSLVCESLEITCDKHRVLYIHDERNSRVPHLYLLPVVEKSSLSGRFVHSKCDFALLQNWIKCCELWHGPCCYTPGRTISPGLPEFTQFRLIDVQEECVVRRSIETRYIALSYVWGKTQGFTTLKENLADLEEPLGLKKCEHMIPRTIADAMTVTRLLSERYLWVDALCIVQNDLHEKHRQIANMDVVYGNAVLTINAAEGRDANSGLWGLPSKPRHVQQKTLEYHPNRHLIIAQPMLTEITNRSYWNTRAWTYQERFLSKRTLTFTTYQVYFECQRIVWCEDVVAERHEVIDYFQMDDFLPIDWSAENNHHMYKLHYSLHVEKSTDWVECLRTVEEYSPRQLSFDSDVLAAFAGMIKVLEEMFNSPFLCGLPESLLHCALLWQPEEKLQPRTPNTDTSTSFPFPTWSWAGWKGKIVYEDIMPHLKMLSSELVRRTKPLVQWQKRSVDGKHLAPVATVGEMGKFLLADFLERSPEGWQSSNGGPFDIFIGTYFFHESYPNKFHAIPTPFLTRKSHNNNIPWMYISCITESAMLNLQVSKTLRDSEPNTPLRVNIVDSSSNWLGSLLMDSVESFDSHAKYEFISLSEGAAPKPEVERFWTDEEWTHIHDGEDSWYFFVNVMLINRDHPEGVARRAGIGKVDSAKWHKVAKSIVNVTLV